MTFNMLISHNGSTQQTRCDGEIETHTQLMNKF